METNVNYTVVGAFVISLIAAITFTIIWLSSGFSFAHYVTYLVYMQESVSGLNVDSQVEYNGVGVGEVKSIQLNAKNPHLVEVYLSIKDTIPITRGTIATLATRGITGLVYVALKDKSTDLTPLVKQPGQDYPIIPTGPSIFTRLDIALNRLSNNMQSVTNSINLLLDKRNLAAIKDTLYNMERVTYTLAANSQQLNVIFQSSANSMYMLESQTLPAAYQLLTNLDGVSRSLGQAANKIQQNPSVLIRGTAAPTLGPGESR
jgi:phospholipid/cholesterol/gamma-HCH transport system substrate-binding protein